ncbi:MAG: IPT/TIG domain-containing protein, partial [Methanoregula sp.]
MASAPDTGGNRADPFSGIDEKLAPAEAAGLKSLIHNTLHAFSYDEATGVWTACNAANQITFSYTPDGTATFSQDQDTFGLILIGIGRDGAISPAKTGVTSASGRQLNITRQEFTEWYRNNDEGVEQGITILNRPAASGRLNIGFRLTGNNTVSVENATTLTFVDATGSPLFTYTGLYAFDSEGRTLPATLATDGTTLSWVVDDTGAVYPVTIDPVVVSPSAATARFTGGALSDYFGNSVSLSSDGTRALVGAYYNGTVGKYAGAAYIFEKPAGGWSSITSASAATARFTGGNNSDYFGNSVSLSSDGTLALVGAYYNDTAGSNAGAAYIFKEPVGGWSGSTSASAATARFTGAAAGDCFGYSVSLSSDGTRALIGAYTARIGSSTPGAAYIFDKPTEGWSGTTSASAATARFAVGGGNDEYFGNSVAFSSDGTLALVGAYKNDTSYTDAGAAYIFDEPAGGWSGTTSATARFTGGATSDFFGWSVSLSSDGTRALVGAYKNDTPANLAGAAYIFEKPAEGWSGTTSASAATARFTGGAEDDQFGYSVSHSSDGKRALVGAIYNKSTTGSVGAAYIFDEPAEGWSGTTSASAATARFTDVASKFGNSVSLSPDGTRVLVGVPCFYLNTGAAYLFQPPYVTLTAGGTTTGAAGTVVDGLTLNPTGTLTNVDLFLGTDAATPTGTAVKTGISSLRASVATTVDGVDLAGKTAGTYYLIVNESGTTTLLSASSSAVYTVTTPTPAPTITVISPDSGPLAAGTLVNITGTNLLGATSVTFGSAAATINTNTATTLNLTAPAGSAGPVTVTVTTPGGTATTSYTYTGNPIDGVIGFRWNTSDPSPRLYQIDSDGTVIPNATGDWFNTHLPWSGMKTVVVNASNTTPVLYGTNNRGDGLDLSGTYGDVMVEIPIFFTCSTYANGNFSYWISPTAQDELHYTVAPMFNQRGTGTDAGTPAPYYYVGRYDANLVGSKLHSATGKAPAVSMTIGTARTYAENKGAGWGITNVWTLSGLRQLFYTEMVTLNSQAAWVKSRGIVDTTGAKISGA